MSDMVGDWVRHIRRTTTPATRKAEEEIQRELEILKQRLERLADPPSLRQQKADLEVTVAKLEHEVSRIAERVQAAEQDARERRDAEVRRLLDGVEDVLARNRVRCYLEILRAVPFVLGETVDPLQLSPEELRAVLNEAQVAGRVREEVGKRLLLASTKVGGTEQALQEVAELRENIKSLASQCSSIRSELLRKHGVDESVLECLDSLSVEHSRRYCEVLREWRCDAVVELGWNLPKNVLSS